MCSEIVQKHLHGIVQACHVVVTAYLFPFFPFFFSLSLSFSASLSPTSASLVMDMNIERPSKRHRGDAETAAGDVLYGTVRTVGVNQVKKLNCMWTICSMQVRAWSGTFAYLMIQRGCRVLTRWHGKEWPT